MSRGRRRQLGAQPAYLWQPGASGGMWVPGYLPPDAPRTPYIPLEVKVGSSCARGASGQNDC